MTTRTLEQDQKHTTCVMLLLHALEHIDHTLLVEEGQVADTIRPNHAALALHAGVISECFKKAGHILRVKKENFWDDALVTHEVKAIYKLLHDLLLSKKKKKTIDIVGFLTRQAEKLGKQYESVGKKLSETSAAEVGKCEKVIERALEMISSIRRRVQNKTAIAKKLLRRALQDPPRIFIGSSKESLNVARTVKKALSSDYEVTLWNDDEVFRAAQIAIDALEAAILEYDLAILVCAADDECTPCGAKKTVPVPRDNVVLELGLFMGRLSHSRVIILKERGIRIPSDLSGMNCVHYTRGPSKSQPIADRNAVCHRIRVAIKAVEKSA